MGHSDNIKSVRHRTFWSNAKQIGTGIVWLQKAFENFIFQRLEQRKRRWDQTGNNSDDDMEHMGSMDMPQAESGRRRNLDLEFEDLDDEFGEPSIEDTNAGSSTQHRQFSSQRNRWNAANLMRNCCYDETSGTLLSREHCEVTMYSKKLHDSQILFCCSETCPMLSNRRKESIFMIFCERDPTRALNLSRLLFSC